MPYSLLYLAMLITSFLSQHALVIPSIACMHVHVYMKEDNQIGCSKIKSK